MRYKYEPDVEDFRQEVKQFIKDNLPPEEERLQRGYEGGFKSNQEEYDYTMGFQKKLSEKGWLAMAWPKEYGGGGASHMRQLVYNEEMAYNQAPAGNMGIAWVGPSLMLYGTEEQKAKFIPRITGADDWWCTLYSEPGAGSDLAALQTRATRDGDDYVINGQKIWTSGGHLADWGWLAARTDPDAPKHKGISYILTPMFKEDGSSNGFELRPIKQPTGGSHFTETFITDAKAPVFNVIGGLHNGWRVTMTTLGNERGGNATTQHVQYTKGFWDAVEEVRKYGKQDDPIVRQQLAWAFSHVEIMRYNGLKTLSEVVAKKEPGPGASINTMFWSEYSQRFAEILMNIRGADSMVMGPAGDDPSAYEPDKWQQNFLSTRSVTIWGGTAQVQRNIVGERVLGLPKEPDAEAQRRGATPA